MTATRNQTAVLSVYPDAVISQGAMTANFMVVSAAWWPGCIGWGSTRAKAWADAARAVSKVKVNEMQNVGRAKYVVNYCTGKKHPDGSDFYDIAIFNNKAKKDIFVKSLAR